MSRCMDCRRELPGFESLCQECYELRQYELEHPKPWWPIFQPRFARGNVYGYCLAFIYGFVRFRFDFPLCDAHYMWTTESSIAVSALLSCLAFFVHPRSARLAQKKSAGQPPRP